MKIRHLELENVTVFDKIEIAFDEGINIFIGENGTGKTHILKILYAACQAADPKTSFSAKIVRTMLPDEFKISRLITRKPGNHNSEIKVSALSEKKQKNHTITASFHNKTKKWDAEIRGEEAWENEFKDISSIFIPAKEILSNSYNLTAAVEKNNVKFDDTYIDIINSARIDISVGRNSAERDKKLKAIEKIIGGTVVYDSQKDEFYLKIGNSRQEFNLVAEGIRKMALLWQLVKNGTLEKGSVLFWDEPEANINPLYLSIITDMLLELQRDGVQIFISTHDYVLAKYFEIHRREEDSVLFHSVSYDEKRNLEYSCNGRFEDLKNNLIIKSFNELLDEIYNS